MKKMTGNRFAVVALMAGLLLAPGLAPAGERGWHAGVGAGVIDFEGDEPVSDSGLISVYLGCEQSPRLSWEAVLDVVPTLDDNERLDLDTGETISRLAEESGKDIDSTSSLRLGMDALLHLLPGRRLDPFLSVGAGLVWYADDFGAPLEPAARAGAGLICRVTDRWALRVDARPLLAGSDTEANAIYTAGVMWTSPRAAGPAAAEPIATGDSDADGIPDAEERIKGTSPFDADTDKDGLGDKDEIDTHRTDPLNADTDYDGLTDGAEVLQHKTDPLKRDTDGGGVADGHEAIEDATDPLQGKDDLTLFELNMTFDDNGWAIKDEYFTELDAIARIIQSDPKSTVRIEGHTDRRPDAKEKDENRLTLRRAGAVEEYFAEKCSIPGGRMKAAGYGFSRPRAANDPAAGNPENRRMEIYIRLPSPKAGQGGS